MQPMDTLERSDPRVQQHTEAMRRLLTSFENGDVRVQTFTIEMNRQLHGLFRLLREMRHE